MKLLTECYLGKSDNSYLQHLVLLKTEGNKTFTAPYAIIHFMDQAHSSVNETERFCTQRYYMCMCLIDKHILYPKAYAYTNKAEIKLFLYQACGKFVI